MPIDHEEISEKIDRLKYSTSVTITEQLISNAKSKNNPDAQLIESLIIRKVDLADKLGTVEQQIKQRQQNRKR